MKKKHIEELKRVMEKPEYKAIVERMHTVEFMRPVHRHAAALAIVDEGGSDKIKEQLKNLWFAGYFDQTVMKVDRTVEKEANEFLDKEMENLKKMGRLPKNHKISQLIKKAWKNKTSQKKSSSSNEAA